MVLGVPRPSWAVSRATILGCANGSPARSPAASIILLTLDRVIGPAPFAAEDKRALGLAAQLAERSQLIALDRMH
jgi:hypothetical protein